MTMVRQRRECLARLIDFAIEFRYETAYLLKYPAPTASYSLIVTASASTAILGQSSMARKLRDDDI